MHLFQCPYAKKETIIVGYEAENTLICGTSVYKCVNVL